MNDFEINMKNAPIKNIRNFASFVIIGFLLISSIYTVDANENAVVLRFGSYSSTTGPGLHFKLPFIDVIKPKYSPSSIAPFPPVSNSST